MSWPSNSNNCACKAWPARGPTWSSEAGGSGGAALDSSRWLLEHLLQAENADRAMRSVNHQMHTAKFSVHRDLAGCEFDASEVDRELTHTLVGMTFTDAAQRAALMRGPGKGKTLLATAIGVAGITRHGRRVRFYSAVGLANALEQKKCRPTSTRPGLAGNTDYTAATIKAGKTPEDLLAKGLVWPPGQGCIHPGGGFSPVRAGARIGGWLTCTASTTIPAVSNEWSRFPQMKSAELHAVTVRLDVLRDIMIELVAALPPDRTSGFVTALGDCLTGRMSDIEIHSRDFRATMHSARRRTRQHHSHPGG